MKCIPCAVVTIVLGVLAMLSAALLLPSLYSVAADEPHSAAVLRVIASLRERSIAAHADRLAVPNLDDPALVSDGAGHYAAMCTGCHLAPGIEDSELRPGLYPRPPLLAQRPSGDPARDFWIIKHGIKMSAMPAWGATHADGAIWSMVAFLRKLPTLSPAAYRQLTAGDAEAESDHDHHGPAVPTAAPGGRSTMAAPVRVVDGFFRALAAGDTRSATALLDPQVTIYESGSVEPSRQEYSAHHLASDVAFLKAVKYRLLSRTGESVGDLAWVATEARMTVVARGKPADSLNTETMVLRKTSDGWHIVHIHWSSHVAE